MPVREMLKRIHEAHRVKTAIHEAGHAVLAAHYGAYIHTLNIVPNRKKGQAGSENHSWSIGLANKRRFADVVISWGGAAADSNVFGQTQTEVESGPSSGDFERIQRHLQYYCEFEKLNFDSLYDKLMAKSMNTAWNILCRKENEKAVLLVAEALLERERLASQEVEKIMCEVKGKKLPKHLRNLRIRWKGNKPVFR